MKTAWRKQWQRIGTAVLLAVATAQCTSRVQTVVRAAPGLDVTEYRTFSWVSQPVSQTTPVELAPEFRKGVRETIARIMRDKGYAAAGDGETADISIAFYANVVYKSRVIWMSNMGYPYHPWGSYWGYGWHGWYDPWHHRTPVIDYYDVGTMVIDVVDVEKNELVWRGWGKGVSYDTTAADELMQAVQEIMVSFPAR